MAYRLIFGSSHSPAHHESGIFLPYAYPTLMHQSIDYCGLLWYDVGIKYWRCEMDWLYLKLVNGRLVDDDGKDANPLWPSFENENAAEYWLCANNIGATVG